MFMPQNERREDEEVQHLLVHGQHASLLLEDLQLPGREADLQHKSTHTSVWMGGCGCERAVFGRVGIEWCRDHRGKGLLQLFRIILCNASVLFHSAKVLCACVAHHPCPPTHTHTANNKHADLHRRRALDLTALVVLHVTLLQHVEQLAALGNLLLGKDGRGGEENDE